MNQLFKGQTNISIILETEFDLSVASNPKIRYRKPDGSHGAWTATIVGSTLVFNPTGGELDMEGMWRFQAYVEIGGAKSYGSIVPQLIDKPL